jgi:hypothetical protein
MEVFYSHHWSHLRGQYTFGDCGKALCSDTDENLWKQASQGWIQGHNTGKGFIRSGDTFAKGCGDLFESSVLQQTGEEQISRLKKG